LSENRVYQALSSSVAKVSLRMQLVESFILEGPGSSANENCK